MDETQNNNDSQSKKKNIVYLEIIRIIAIIGVLFNHTNQYGFFMFPTAPDKAGYFISMVFSILCKMSVPLFFMISGYLLLGKKETLSEVIRKRVIRYGLVILLASAFTYILTTLYNGGTFSVRELIKIVYRGDYGTYWFMYAYLGLMIMLPFLRGIAGVLSKTVVYYLVALRIFFIGIIPIVIFISLGYFMNTALSITILEDSIFYFLVGFYFGTAENFYDSAKNRTICRIVSCVCIIISCCMIYYEYIVSDSYTENFLNSFIPIISVIVFCMIRYHFENAEFSDRVKKAILFIGDKTLGIYLLEPVIRTYFDTAWRFYIESYYPLIAAFLWCITVFVIGLLVTWLLKLIPAVRRII